jgi:hypothetical protein
MDIKFFLVPAALAVLLIAGCPKDGPAYDPANPGDSPTVEPGGAAEDTGE